MSLDTLDPNEPENYDNSQEVLDPTLPQKPVTTTESSKDSTHPLVAVMLAYLKRYPIVERWTVMDGLISHTVEFRIMISKPEKIQDKKDMRSPR